MVGHNKLKNSLSPKNIAILTLAFSFFAITVLGTIYNPAKSVQSQTDGNTTECRVGIAVDRSGSVAVRHILNPYIMRAEINSLFEPQDNPLPGESEQIDNRINDPSIYLTFWSFGTVASPFDHNRDGNTEYPFYSYRPPQGNSQHWINTGNATEREKSTWFDGINSIELVGNRDPLIIPPWVEDMLFNEDSEDYDTREAKEYRRVWGVKDDNGEYKYFKEGEVDAHNNINAGDYYYFDFFPEHDDAGQLDPIGGKQYGEPQKYEIEVQGETYIYEQKTSDAMSTNWEAALGRDQGDNIDGWDGLDRAADADVIVLLTDAYADKENLFASTWYDSTANKEPNQPTDDHEENVGLALDAAQHWRDHEKEIVVLSYEEAAKDDGIFQKMTGGGKDNIHPLGGDGEGIAGMGQALRNIALEQCSERPYMKFYGHDVIAGGRFGLDDEGECSPYDSNASIRTRSTTNSSNDNVASSTEFAAYALDKIQQFHTAGTRQGFRNSPSEPEGLAFGNFDQVRLFPEDALAGDSGIYRCAPDFFAQAPDSTSSAEESINISALESNQTIKPQDGQLQLHASGSTGNITGNKTLYVDGDVVITDDITLEDNFSSIGNIPSFYLIVRGDVYISSDVIRLDGVYIAQPDSDDTGGNIYTCSTEGRSLHPSNAMFDNCNSQLTINGAFIAQKVHFLRTHGTLSDANLNDEFNEGQPAERFRFTPELYLNSSRQDRDEEASPKYDSIRSLPPIL